MATVELQGYLYAARLPMAELFEALGDSAGARDQRLRAKTLAELVDQRFFDPRGGSTRSPSTAGSARY